MGDISLSRRKDTVVLMSINSAISKENLTIIEKLSTQEIRDIAKTISVLLSKTFPEHNLKESDLFIAICRLNMYRAKFNDNAKAKYFYKNSSIYFDNDIDLKKIDIISLHECIHYLQEYRDEKDNVVRMGLYNLKNRKGMAINEAAVQYMASIACKKSDEPVKYYNMEFSTISPDFYPLQTALLEEMLFFTGSYSLIRSTLFSDDVFRKTFISKTSKKIYSEIETNFEDILEYENTLSRQAEKLANTVNDLKSINKIKKINSIISDLKEVILAKTLETQDLIYKNCFQYEFNNIRNLKDCKKMKYRLFNFRNLLIKTDNYDSFSEFYTSMMLDISNKAYEIKQNGEITPVVENYDLTLIEDKSSPIALFKILIHKIKLIFEEKIRQKDF